MFVGSIVPPAISRLLEHSLMSSLTHEIYIPRREESVLEMSHRLEIKSPTPDKSNKKSELHHNIKVQRGK